MDRPLLVSSSLLLLAACTPIPYQVEIVRLDAREVRTFDGVAKDLRAALAATGLPRLHALVQLRDAHGSGYVSDDVSQRFSEG